LLAQAQLGEAGNVSEILTEAVERELYGQAIRIANGDQTKAARWLGVSRPTMREKLTRYGLFPTRTSDTSLTRLAQKPPARRETRVGEMDL
jgi:DNA-binding NtrC family response regulator